MKTLPPILKYVGLAIAVGSVLVIANCAQWQRGPVTIEKNRIILHPGTQISQADAKALNEILKKYDKSLYRIDIYRNGQKQKSLGQLSDVYLDRTVESEGAMAKGNLYWAHQVAGYVNPALPPIPQGGPPNPAGGSAPPPSEGPAAAKELIEQQKLIEALKPILGKYTK